MRLAGTPTSTLCTNIATTLPDHVRLKGNPLGPNCTIGAPDAPFVLHLTDGTKSPPQAFDAITDATGTVTDPGRGVNVLELNGQRLVNNAFAVPAPTERGPLGLLNGAVNTGSRLRRPPG